MSRESLARDTRPLRSLAIVHQRDAGPGVFAEAIRARDGELHEWLVPEQEDPPGNARDYDAVLVFGGAMHADQEDRHPWLRGEKELLGELLACEVPTIGVCLGAQLLADAAGAPPRRAARPEIGWHQVDLTEAGVADPVLGPLAPGFVAFQWHSYEFPVPPGAALLASSPVCPQAYRIGEWAWGIQFHAEVSRDDANAWIDDYRSDEDAVRIGLEPEPLRRQTRTAIGAWNALGRSLCDRFLDAIRV